ncbi:MAG: thiamine biosynthesis lipoprotein [Planctomycetota bacterium]|jgi:thiamine biosynthesis lipoprotein
MACSCMQPLAFRSMQKLRTFWLLGVTLMALSSCSDPITVRGFTGRTMGSTYEVKVATKLPLADIQAIVGTELTAFDVAFSNWRKNSEIQRVNAHRSTEPFEVSERFANVLRQALAIAKATNGAFDPTVKPLSDLYRRAKENPGLGLDDSELLKAKERAGYQFVSIENGKLTKQREDVQLDLDGIVAGAAADAIAVQLLAIGVDSFYLQITGEVLCHGVKPDGVLWRIGVVDPASDVAGGQQAAVTVPLLDRALCSSGDYRNAVIVGNRVVHHLFDPRTGRNPEHAMVSASVIAKSCAVADALGTALMVLGDEETEKLWPALQSIGAESALFLKPGVETQWEVVRIEWPAEDS